MATLRQLANRADKLLDDRQRARFDELNSVEKLLFVRLITEMKGLLDVSDGRITSKKGYVTIAKAIDQVFDSVETSGLGPMGNNMVKDMVTVLATTGKYYSALKIPRKGPFRDIQDAVDATMRKRLGIDPEGGIQKKGYLDQLFATNPARDEIKKMVAKAVAGGIPPKKLQEDLEMRITGGLTNSKGKWVDAKIAGVLERKLGGFVLGSYRLADNVTNNEFGKKLTLRYFIYSGGLIETSRQFCRKKNNKVFSTEEALRDWPLDPDLLKTKAERQLGGPPADYQPLEDLGRWEGDSDHCRHRLLYISDQMAFDRRPELRRK